MRTAAIPCLLALATGAVRVEAQQANLRFEVISIRRTATPGPTISGMQGNTYHGTSEVVHRLIQFAYDLREDQLVGGPGWLKNDRFDITAKTSIDTATLTYARQRVMLQALLEERFGLLLIKEQREADVYTLRLARDDGRAGPDLHRMDDDCVNRRKDDYSAFVQQFLRDSPRPSSGARMSHTAVCTTIDGVAEYLSGALATTVVNQTGLTGSWSYVLAHRSEAMVNAQDERPSLIVAVQEQLGLKLEKRRGVKDVWVIKSVHLPTEN